LKIRSTLKLDSSYRPIQIIDALEAFGMIYLERATIVEVYHNEYIRSAHDRFPIPSVIVVKKYIRKDRFRMRCNRKNVFWRDRYSCQYCGSVHEGKDLTLDHVVPRSRGGLKVWQNVVTCCRRCNQKKGDKYLEGSGMSLLKKPIHPSPYIFRSVERLDAPGDWIPYLLG
jgi:5-methylcytosine-specific restriction endonuclease McrA